jgi:hypothetical protein
MNTNKKNYLIFVATFFCTTNLLNGMLPKISDIFDLKELNEHFKTSIDGYGQEKLVLDLSNQEITEKYLTKNQGALQDFINLNKIQILDLQRNQLTMIPPCILKILFQCSTLHEINIETPTEIEYRTFGTKMNTENLTPETMILEIIKILKESDQEKTFEIILADEKSNSKLQAEKIINFDEDHTIYLTKKNYK